MKKVILSFVALLLTGFMAQSQTNGQIVGTVVDTSQLPIDGMAIFYLGVINNLTPQEIEEKAYWPQYTNYLGEFHQNYFGPIVGDTLAIGAFDCAGNFYYESVVFTSNNQSDTVAIQITGCTPGPCDALLRVDSLTWNNSLVFEALSLRDSISVFPGTNHTIIHEWNIAGTTYPRGFNNGSNWDTLIIPMSSLPSNFQFCYQRTLLCNWVCDSFGTSTNPPTPAFCNADFYVDTVNSINFNGQIVMWENSTTSRGNIIDWYWTFGDGGFSNQQYPTYTYSDTNVYEICLKITAVDGGDTCVSTYCDSVGFDSNGNLHKSTGFTVKVMDPATIGQLEEELVNHFSLYPNPSNGTASLSWSEAVHVNEVQVISMSGQVLKSVKPQAGLVKLETLESGAYILRISSDEGVASLKMIVE